MREAGEAVFGPASLDTSSQGALIERLPVEPCAGSWEST